MTEHDYLFDKTEPGDPEVVRLEHLLGRFRHRPGPARRHISWRWVAPLLVLAAAGVAVCVCWPARPDDSAFGLLRGDGAAVATGEWVEAGGAAEHLTMPNLGWLTLAPGGRLRLGQLDTQHGRLWLEHGQLEAFVYPSVRPRFFQVETPATTCVDLGCKYLLDVDPVSKRTHVRVTLGRVAFTEHGREVYVPRDAECSALPGHGVGTPRFLDCSAELRQRLDGFDAADTPADRRAAAEQVAEAALTERDTLPLWHLLADADAEVRRQAEAALLRLVGPPPRAQTVDGWREHLEGRWW